MDLTSTDELLISLGVVNAADETVRKRYDQLRRRVEEAIRKYCKWGIDAVDDVIEYHSGDGSAAVRLLHPFVRDVADVWLDSNGYFGDGPGAFPAASKLTKGDGYVLVKEDTIDMGSQDSLGGGSGPELIGRSGLIQRLNNTPSGFFPSDLLFYRQPGGLAYRKGAYWPAGVGNIKVQYSYGFKLAPNDIRLAVETAVAVIQHTTRYGFPVGSEGLGDYNYSLATSIARDSAFGGVRDLLGIYRNVTL